MSDEGKRVSRVLSATIKGIQNLQNIESEVWESALGLLSERKGKIVVTGVGKSGYVAMKLAATLTSLGQQAVFLHPVEAFHGDSGSMQAGDILIAFSFSGGTREILQFVSYAKDICGVEIICITQNSDTPLGLLSSVVIPVKIEEEGCPLNLAPMASTTTMLSAGDALAAGITSPEKFTEHDFAKFHPGGSLGLSLTPVHRKMSQSPNMMIRSNVPLQKTLQRLSEVGKGVLAVVDEYGFLEGSVTDGDIRRFFSKNINPKDPITGDVMTKNPKFVIESETLKDALALMELHKITNVFVVNNEKKPLGIIHIHDIIN